MANQISVMNPFSVLGMLLAAGLLLAWFQSSRPQPCDKIRSEPCRERDLLDDLLNAEPLPR